MIRDLTSFSPAEILAELRPRGIRLGLETARRLLTALGEPQNHCAHVLVAGTNGKGSTAALLANMAEEAGYQTGLFTSPHLVNIEEQIQLSRRSIARHDLARHLRAVLATAEEHGLEPTGFETLYAAALVAFAEQNTDLAILEVGLGGARDCTNVVDAEAAVLTTVGLDHAEFLGHDLPSIATEKAGIFRRSRPAVLGWLVPEAMRAARHEAERVGAEPILATDSVRHLSKCDHGFDGQHVTLGTSSGSHALDLALPGSHQARNLALAVLAAEALACRGWHRFDTAAIARGAAACRWPGRLEARPYHDRTILLDAAHNPAGATALASFLEELAQPYELLFGALNDKDAEAMLHILAPNAERVVLTSPDDPRARTPHDLARICDPRWPKTVLPRPRLEKTGPLLVVTGSVRLVGDICHLLEEDLTS